MKKIFVKCTIILALSILLGACTLRPSPLKDENGKDIYRLQLMTAMDDGNPYGSLSDESAIVLSLIYDTLFVRSPQTGEYEGNLCTAWDTQLNPDGTVLWTLELKQGVLWQDGTNVTSRDVEFSLQSAKDLSARSGNMINALMNVVGIAVVDDYHIKFTAWNDYSIIPELLSRVWILPEHIWNKFEPMHYDRTGIPVNYFSALRDIPSMKPSPELLVGSGPFLVETINDSLWQLKSWEHYHGNAPVMERIEIRMPMLCEPENLLDISFADGWLNLSHLPAADTRFAGAVQGTAGKRFYCLLNPFGSDVLSDDSLRCAVLNCITGKSEEAVYILNEHGCRDEDGDGIREIAGEKLQITLRVEANSKVWDDYLNMALSGLNNAGINTEIHFCTVDELISDLAHGNYQAVFMAADDFSDPMPSYGQFYSGNLEIAADYGKGIWQSDSFAEQSKYNSIYERAIQTKTRNERAELTIQLEDILMRNGLCANLPPQNIYQVFSAAWYGYKEDPVRGLFLSPFIAGLQLIPLNK